MIYYSPSRLSTYQSCPQHYKIKYVDKVVTEKETGIPAFIGVGVHSALEHYFGEEGKETEVSASSSPSSLSLRSISLDVIEKSVGEMNVTGGVKKAARKYAEASIALYERAQPDYVGPDAIRTKEGKVSSSPMSTSAWKEASRNAGLDIYKDLIDEQSKVGIADACAEIHSICVNYKKPLAIGRVLGVEVSISKREECPEGGAEVIINPVRIPNSEAYLHGYIDMVCESEEGELGVVDYKSGVTGYEESDLQWNPQLMLYSWAVEQIYGREVTWVGIHNLRHSLVKTRINKEKREIVLQAIWESIRLIESGVFPKKLMDSPYSTCKKWYGKPCPYMNLCWPTDRD